MLSDRNHRLYAFLVFALAVTLRWQLAAYVLDEGDERVYTTLTENVLAGHAYSIQDSPYVTQGKLPISLYGRPVFFHPPFAIYLFALFVKLFGAAGYALAQIFCFALTYGALLACVQLLYPRLRGGFAYLVAPLAALTPILVNLNLHVWLDNVKVALFTSLFYVLLRAARSHNRAWWIAAAALALAATLTKLDALGAFPFAFLVVLGVAENRRRTLLRLAAITAPCLLAALLWSLHADTLVHPPSLPTAESRAMSPFTHHWTDEASLPGFALSFLKIVGTFLPSVLLLFALRPRRDERRLPLLFSLWAGGLLLFYVGTSAFGYAKLLRYLCLAVPATVLLFAGVVDALRASPRRRSGLVVAAAALLLAGYVVEIAHGLHFAINVPRAAQMEALF